MLNGLVKAMAFALFGHHLSDALTYPNPEIENISITQFLVRTTRYHASDIQRFG